MSMAGPRFTYDDYKLLPEDKRYEIIEGELLMTPAPNVRHQRVLMRLANKLYMSLETERLGAVLPAPTDVVLDHETVVQPDILFVSAARQELLRFDGAVHGAPDLVVEILSPSTASRDKVVKRKLYQKYGVREMWIVDPEAQTIEVCDFSGETGKHLAKESALTSALLPGFQMPLSDIFPD
ncbi:MAG: hypothetical protein K0R39_3354 [Symbiobacteriaceae bacterium]|nr:hypothetical protein [Symbiobacteriaceae bacterium]